MHINELIAVNNKKRLGLRWITLIISGITLLLVFLSIALALLAVFTGQSGVAELLGWPKALTIQEINYNWKVICGIVALLDIVAFIIHRVERAFDLRGHLVSLEHQGKILINIKELSEVQGWDQAKLDEALLITKTLFEK